MRGSGFVRAAVFAALCAFLAVPSAFADRGGRGYHGHSGHHHRDRWSTSVVIGLPLYFGPRYVYPGSYYDPYPYPRYPRTVVIERAAPTVQVSPGPPPAQYWYYCDAAGAYYPYVSSCPEPWRTVPAVPPGAP